LTPNTETLNSQVFEKSESVGKVRKVEKRFLGSISFPFTTLYASAASGRIDGVFALDAPVPSQMF
jgi:hypothetical protein